MYRARSGRDLRSRPTRPLWLQVLKFQKALALASRWASVVAAEVAVAGAEVVPEVAELEPARLAQQHPVSHRALIRMSQLFLLFRDAVALQLLPHLSRPLHLLQQPRPVRLCLRLVHKAAEAS